MLPTYPLRSGRPPRSSRGILEEAAAELFLEQGYAGTTIDQISRRAGVSRNTFFHYFPAKSDLLWVGVDAALAELPAALAACPAELTATDAARWALLRLAAAWGPAEVPWALTQSEVMGTRSELEASALSRLARAAPLLARCVAARAVREPGELRARLLAQGFAGAVLAVAAVAVATWARAGVDRGELSPYLDEVITPVCTGYAPLFG
ncbi:TetR family transcriptional regulator [Cryobacterium frigoriphilum]|uniref:TetR family transcriptional regulator n=1 Tax=Cryobacterium frigoriphilum TaxID=1259150 RepID=A0A4R9AA41_9MICO|nr:TetR family transcriptional regulator [Cryobacterium frigoriphilum]TFD55145.1 TetR family transcriptional regulator [Cryobacterium frigoriphilum]